MPNAGASDAGRGWLVLRLVECFVFCTFVVPPVLAAELDRRFGGEVPEFATGDPPPVRLWSVPAVSWPQHLHRHAGGVPAHGFEIGWLPPVDAVTPAIRVESQCHRDAEHARVTIEDLVAWFAESFTLPVTLVRSEIYG